MRDTPPSPRLLPPIVPTRRLRVLVFTTVFPNTRQPLHGTFVLERIRHLAALADIEVVAPIPWFRAFRARASGTQADPIIAIRHPKFWYLPKLLKYFRGVFLFMSTVGDVARLRATFDFDLIDAHFAYPDGFAAVLLGMWFRRPACVTLRGTIVQWSQRRIGRWLCDWTMQHAERVIAVAESLAARARQGDIPEQRIATIPNGVDTARFGLMDRAAARRSLGLPEAGRLLVSVGHISPRKGFHRVIRSLPRVLQSSPDVRLAIVGGKGAEEDNSAALEALAGQLGLSEMVLFVGAQTPDQVALWLAAADVFVLASDYEGCPNVVLEAMACGRPVVGTKVGDIERMVPTFAGILFDDPEDQVGLAESLMAALTREWDAERIREHLATRSWDDVARRVMVQWLLALESFGARASGRAARSPKDRVIRDHEQRKMRRVDQSPRGRQLGD
jgi:teichuronic acid biosynthesis glycosyltransferase TuaC